MGTTAFSSVRRQFREESRAAGANGELQRAAEGPEEAPGGGDSGCSPKEQHTAEGEAPTCLYHPQLCLIWMIRAVLRMVWACADSASMTLP